MMELISDAVAVIGFVVLFTLMLLRVPVGMAMGLVGVSGFGYLVGGTPALKMVGQTSMRTVTDYTFGVIPMFLLMGAFVSRSGIEPRAVPGGQQVCRPSARRPRHRDDRCLCGLRSNQRIIGCHRRDILHRRVSRDAAPPLSAILFHRGDRRGWHAWRDVSAIDRARRVWPDHPAGPSGKLFMAGILPGLLAVSMCVATIAVIGAVRPSYLPAAPAQFVARTVS